MTWIFHVPEEPVAHIAPPIAHERARVASLSRSRTPDDPELIDARRNLKCERLAVHIAQTVAAWPPLRGDQLDRLAVLLRGGAA